MSPLTKPITPSVNQQQPRKPYQPQIDDDTTDESIRLQNKEIVKNNIQILPPGKRDIESLEFETDDNEYLKSQRVSRKEKELNLKRSELNLAREEDRDKLKSEIYQLNLKLEELKNSANGPNIQGAQFRLNEDDEGFFVDLINVEQDVVIKELSVESVEDILKQTSDSNNLGVIMDLFA